MMKKILLSFSLFAAVLSAQADGFGAQVWSGSINAFTDKDKVVNNAPVAVASDGSVYAAGSFNTAAMFGSTLIDPIATSAYIAKYNNDGDEQWAAALRGAAEVRSLTTDGDGNVYAVGVFTDVVRIKNGNDATETVITGKTNDTSKSSFFIVKFDKDGALVAHQVVVPTVKPEIAADTDKFFEEAGNTYFRSTKVMWVDNKVYFTAQYTGVGTLAGQTLEGSYFLYGGFMYVSIPKMGVYSLNASTLTNLKEEISVALKPGQSEEMTTPESINFTYYNNTLYAAFVATGAVTVTTPNKTEDLHFALVGDKKEHGFVLSEVSGVTYNHVYRSSTTDVLTNYNFVNAMTFDAQNIYVAGTFNQPSVFGVAKTFQGAADAYVAAFNRSSSQLRWVATSNVNEGDAKKNTEVVSGLIVADGKVMLTAYAEETTAHKPQAGFVYLVNNNGTLAKRGDDLVLGLANNHALIVTSGNDNLETVFTAFEIDETTGVRSLTADTEIVRHGDVFTLSTPADIIVTDVQGRTVLTAKGAQNVSVSPLVKGLYILKAGAKTVKFVK